MLVNRVVVGVVGALMLSTASPAHALGGLTAVRLTDGTVRYGVAMLQIDYTSQLVIDNGENEVIRVEYSDPTYGYQTITVGPNHTEVAPLMCADPTYAATSPLKVTFSPGTTSEVTGTGAYYQVISTAPAQAKILVDDTRNVLTKAKAKLRVLKAKLKRAREVGAPLRIKRLVRQVRIAKARVVTAKANYYSAKQAYEVVMSEAEYCQARRVS